MPAENRIETLRLGVPQMDSDHGLQVGLLEALEDSVAQGGEGAMTDAILEKLIDLTNAHFLAEELMMRLHKYAQYEVHVEEHDRLIRELRDVRKSCAAGDRSVTLEDVHTLWQWLTGHIQTKDRAFAAHVVARPEPSRLPG